MIKINAGDDMKATTEYLPNGWWSRTYTISNKIYTSYYYNDQGENVEESDYLIEKRKLIIDML